MPKYALLRQRVVTKGLVPPHALLVPDPVSDEDLRRAHQPAYVERVVQGALTAEEIRRIGFPWSPELVERSRRSAGGTVAAGRAALQDGVGVNLAGGTHHAGPARGEGFCVFNDAAVAIRALEHEGAIRSAVVFDCDVHQGNGTAIIFRDDPAVRTVSIHGARNYPFRKAQSDLDVPLDDGTGDEPYLDAVRDALDWTMQTRSDLAVYISGADPFHGDALGRLGVTRAGLAERDRLVLGRFRDAGIPVAVVMAGGYSPNVTDIVAIHLNTVRAAVAAGRTSRV